MVSSFFSFLCYYMALYKKFISICFQLQLNFRINYIMTLFVDLFFLVSALLSVYFIFDHIENIGPWRKEQLLFFLSFALTMDAFYTAIFVENFWRLGGLIKSGEFDYLLLRPSFISFSSFFQWFRSTSLVGAPAAMIPLIVYGLKLPLAPLDWILLPFLLLSSILLMALMECCISTLIFWMTEGEGINFARAELQNLSRWPAFVYQGLPRKILTWALPYLLVTYAPVQFLYNKRQWPILLQLIFLIVTFYFIFLFIWNKGIKHYDSASS